MFKAHKVLPVFKALKELLVFKEHKVYKVLPVYKALKV